MIPRRSFLAASAGGVIAASANALSQVGMSSSLKTGYAAVNGLKLYYELHGTGEPLILLHGGLGSIEMLGELFAGACKDAEGDCHGFAGARAHRRYRPADHL